MGGFRTRVALRDSTHELGRYLTIKGDTLKSRDEVRPDWFQTPLTRDSFVIPEDTQLVLVEVRSLKRVVNFNVGSNVVTYPTELVHKDEPELRREHTLVIPAGTVVKVLPDFSFFVSDVLIRRSGMKSALPGQATFYPPKPPEVAAHANDRARLVYSVALRVYSGTRF